MAELVAAAIAERRHLVVQAGTGTGKTLAYLVPAIESGAHVVVATATKALQDQLAGKDLPFLDDALDVPFDWAVLKGRSNYVCLQRLREMHADAAGQLELEDMAATTREEIARIAEWVATTDTGDGAELPWSPSDAAWRSVSVGSDECPGADRCPLGDPCFAEQARRRAQAADVVVVNTHLYGLHVGSGGVILPEHDVVVFDEAHVLEDVMSDTVGVQLAPGRFITMAGDAAADPRRPAAARRRCSTSPTCCATRIGPHAGQRLPMPYPAEVQEALVEARTRLDRVIGRARRHPDPGRRRQAAQAARPDRHRAGHRAPRPRAEGPRRATSTTCRARPSTRAWRSPRSTSGRCCATACGRSRSPS